VPVSAYGLRPGSKIALIGGDAQAPTGPSAEAKPAPRTEQSTIAHIQSELDGVRTRLAPDVDAFLAGLAGALTPQQATEHVRLGELLLQALLRLDAVSTEGEWADARAERKGAVREVQGLLDTLDARWKEAKAGTATLTAAAPAPAQT
jgi:hypothetical protein